MNAFSQENEAATIGINPKAIELLEVATGTHLDIDSKWRTWKGRYYSAFGSICYPHC